MRVFENMDVAFVQNRGKAYIVSGVLIAAAIISLATRQLETGIDFQGGMEFVIETEGNLDVTTVRNDLAGVLDAAPEVKSYGDGALLVRATTAAGDAEAVADVVVSQIKSAFPDSNARIGKSDTVSPRFAEDLKRGAIYSIIGALFVIFLYVAIRFEWRYSIGAVVALLHDIVITLGLFSLLHGWLPFSLQIDQTIIAAFLTIVGYSLNDTVVVFDRIREYANVFKTEPFEETVNRSVNRTLSRTIITSGTTLLVVVVLFIFGGEVLKGFAFALIIGIGIGTYSSIFVAAPVVVELRKRYPVRR
ncbi:MAG: protein translocase subunit SecF [Bacteroidetes bacterium]|nr:protein translocase subunit SecF [Bacteroidota bacterium]